MSKKIDGGELFVKTIKGHSVKDVFTLHGGHLDAIYQACIDYNINVIDFRHEAAVGHAAESYTRLSSGIGIALVTAGPGFTNVITSITNAYLDCIPVLYVAGAPPLRDAELNPLQGGFDQVAMVKPVTKWSHQITQTHQIPELVNQAIKLACSGRPGPVFLEIPIDVLFAKVNEAAVTIRSPLKTIPGPGVNEQQLQETIKLLLSAERPAILVGGGAALSDCGPELLKFVERAGIPVFSNNRAHGLIPGCHPLSGRAFGNLAALPDEEQLRPDVVMLLGARFGMFTGGVTDRLLPSTSRFIQVDKDVAELGRIRDVEVPVVADCRLFLEGLNHLASSLDWPSFQSWQESVRKARSYQQQQFADAPQNDDVPIHPYRAAEVIADMVDSETIIVTDGGEAKSWIEMNCSFPVSNSYFTLGYLGCLGTGMPMAIGAKIARPDKKVICITGDGAVGLNIQEFDTMMRHGYSIVTIVFNNHSWGMSAHAQDIIYGPERRVASDLHSQDYSEIAAAWGCYHRNIEKLSDLRPAVEAALAAERPACLNIMIDYDIVAPYTLGMLGSWQKEQEIVLPYYDNLDA